MSREDDPLFYRLDKEFESEDVGDRLDEEIGKFIRFTFPGIWTYTYDDYENRERTGRAAVGHVMFLPREQRDELWAKFQLEREP